MRHYRKYVIVLISLAALLMTLSGCFKISADELYSLPQASKEFLKLQEQINLVLASGAEYAAPTAGSNRQSVQLKDVDGDGVSEAIVFFRKKENKPLKIYIMKQSGGTYVTADIIEGVGTSIERIIYADMDGDGVSEFIVGWQNAALLHMTIYSIKDDHHFTLGDTDYTQLVTDDINGDGHEDVIALRLPSSDFPGEADMFSLRSDGEPIPSVAYLSKGIESITRVIKGYLSDGTPAIFVEGGYNGSMVTDILAWRYGGLDNITASVSSGASENTLRAYAINSTDINKDGIVEVPMPKLLPSAPDTQYYVIDWYTFDKFGHKNRVYTTYHDNADSWFMILPNDWEGNITVKRDDTVSGERTLIFSYIMKPDKNDPESSADELTPLEFLKIYTLSGDNKEDRAKLPNRITLMENSDTIYAAEILTTAVDLTVNEEIIKAGFKPLISDWANGVA